MHASLAWRHRSGPARTAENSRIPSLRFRAASDARLSNLVRRSPLDIVGLDAPLGSKLLSKQALQGMQQTERLGGCTRPTLSSCHVWVRPSFFRCQRDQARFHDPAASAPAPRRGACRLTCADLMLPDRFETARLILRPIEPRDAPAIFTGYAQDPEVVRFLIWRPHKGLADTEAYIARCMAALPDRSRTSPWSGAATASCWARSNCGDPNFIGSIAATCWRVPFGGAV